MQLRRINNLIIVIYLLLVCFTLTSIYVAGYYQKQSDVAVEQQRLSLMYADQLMAGSKKLTESVRSFAATGNNLYEQDYRTEVSVTHSRDKAVNALSSLGITENEFALIKLAKLMSDTLIDLENRSFQAGKEGNQKLAVELVYGQQYQDALNKIYSPINEFRQLLQTRMRLRVADTQRMAEVSRMVTQWLTIFSYLIILGMVFWVYRRHILNPLLVLSEQVQTLLLHKEDDIKISYIEMDSEIGNLARSIEEYQKIAQQMNAQHWVKSALNEISSKLQQANTFTELAQTLLSELAPLLDIGHGVFYINDVSAHTLRLIGSYGYRERKHLNQYFAFGEGLVGQCAMEKVPITLTDPPDDYIKINSGIGEATPVMICTIPVLLQDHLQGVIELASFRPFNEREVTLLDQLMLILAMHLEVLERSIHTGRLLKESQLQANRMEQQTAQLEEQAVELEAHQEALKETETWYLKILESLPIGTLVIDGMDTIILHNPLIATLFGYSGDELIGQSIATLMSFQRGEAPLEDDRKNFGFSKPMTARRKDGTQISFKIELSNLPFLGSHRNCVLISLLAST